ncbi:hypothetical protein [Tsuneonella mangrovi]|uniref:hypothetical protein n=1 Tax=Tsuneonella mangrovi TaxID=1982042 RepID=UPI000BA22781|nr:hypothetical protein [Tsuneonella mangrovi]
MRIALLSALGAQFGEPGRGLLPFAGRTVLALQVDAAHALGCSRVVCLAETVGPEIAALQHQCDDFGIKFNAIAAHRSLSGLVSANDEVLVIAPGLVADHAWLKERFSDRAGVAVLPVESGLEHGFERIDRDRAWGGLLLVRGDAVESLTALPADGDAIAGLLRIALQRGVRAIPVPESALDDGRWSLVRSQAIATRLERQWLKQHVPSPAWTRPTEALGYRIAQFVSTRNRTRWLPNLMLSGSTALAVGAGLAGQSGRVAAGFLALLLAGLLAVVAQQLARFARAGGGSKQRELLDFAFGVILDAALIAVSAGIMPEMRITGMLAASVVVAAMRLSREPEAPVWARPFGDRALVYFGALWAAVAGVPALGLAGIGIVGLFARLLKPFRRS